MRSCLTRTRGDVKPRMLLGLRGGAEPRMLLGLRGEVEPREPVVDSETGKHVVDVVVVVFGVSTRKLPRLIDFSFTSSFTP